MLLVSKQFCAVLKGPKLRIWVLPYRPYIARTNWEQFSKTSPRFISDSKKNDIKEDLFDKLPTEVILNIFGYVDNNVFLIWMILLNKRLSFLIEDSDHSERKIWRTYVNEFKANWKNFSRIFNANSSSEPYNSNVLYLELNMNLIFAIKRLAKKLLDEEKKRQKEKGEQNTTAPAEKSPRSSILGTFLGSDRKGFSTPIRVLQSDLSSAETVEGKAYGEIIKLCSHYLQKRLNYDSTYPREIVLANQIKSQIQEILKNRSWLDRIGKSLRISPVSELERLVSAFAECQGSVKYAYLDDPRYAALVQVIWDYLPQHLKPSEKTDSKLQP